MATANSNRMEYNMQQLVPKLRFPEFTEKWETKKFQNLFSTFKSGNGITSSKIAELGVYPVYGGNGLRGFTDTFTHDGFYFLIGRQGALCGNINRSFGKSYISEHAIACQANETSDTEWLAQRLAYYNLNRLSESSAQPGLAVNKLLQLLLVVPSLTEQTKIAEFLIAIDKRIELLTTKKEKLTLYKKGVMQKIFNQEIRFKPDEGGEFPEWEERTLGEVGSIVSGLTYSPADVIVSGTLVLRSSNVQNRNLAFNDNVYVSTTKFNPVLENDILICVRNGSKALIGKNALITHEVEGCAFGAFMTVYRSRYNKFLFHWFDSDDYYDNVRKNLGATINSINGSDLKKFRIPFPSSNEQTKIASFLTSLDVEVKKVDQQITLNQTYKKGLLQQMFV